MLLLRTLRYCAHATLLRTTLHHTMGSCYVGVVLPPRRAVLGGGGGSAAEQAI